MDSCYNVPAIGSDGSLNTGMDPCEITAIQPDLSKGCREPGDLDNNNVYSRTRCNNGWCAYMYGYYMQLDGKGHCDGHRHDWEHVVVWTEGETIRYVAAGAHAGYDVRAIDDVMQDNGHPKIVYHKDGTSTHAFRFAKDGDDPPENAKGSWFYGTVVSYFGFPNAELRDSMLTHDWEKGHIDFTDEKFPVALDSAKGGNDIPLDVNVDDEGTTDRPC